MGTANWCQILTKYSHGQRRGPRPPTYRAPAGARGAVSPPACLWGPLGAAEVKSIWPRSAGPHTCHKGRPSRPRRRQPERARKSAPSSDRTPHRVRDAETVSNRASAGRGEARSGSAHTAHHARKAQLAGPAQAAPWGGPGRDRLVGNLSEVDTR